MITKKLKYTDFDGREREETVRFNLTEKEVFDLEFGTLGGISEFYQRIIEAQNTPEIIAAIDKIVLAAYGIKTADGRGFQKSKEISDEFKFTQGYSNFMMELYTDDEKAFTFIKELIPEEVIKKIEARLKSAAEKQEKKKIPFEPQDHKRKE